MDSDLEQVAEVGQMIDDAGISWWVSYGTLLGLVRDGGLIPWDGDVDLSCWAQPHGWANLQSGLERNGWTVDVRSYRNMIFKYQLRRGDCRRIDIKVWRRDGNSAWYPAVQTSTPPRSTLRGILHRVLRRIDARTGILSRNELVSRAAQPLGFHVHTCVMPTELLNERTEIKASGLSFPAPARFEELLSLQYGQWKVPVRDWDYRHDDPTFVFARPPRVRTTEPMMGTPL
jgi:hypothetical protein